MIRQLQPPSPSERRSDPPVCLFIPSFGDGGVERMLVNLARGLAAWGVSVDFVTSAADAPFLDRLPPAARLHLLGNATRRGRREFLEDYIRRAQPAVILSAKTEDDRIALAARRRAGGDTRCFLRPGTTLSERWRARGKPFWQRWWERRRLRQLFRQADGVVAVSQGVADDVLAITGIPPERLRVIRNPNLTPELAEEARAPLDHPWFAAGQPPVILGAGGLRSQKDFATLIRAFALVRARLPCRLAILGEGRQRARLLRLARDLGLAESVALPGFVANPHAWLARARLFVLSSLWEGSPNVLTEALALGVPAVATDCRSGPREILRDGEYGPLVPVGDVEAMAAAMERTLRDPPDGAWLATAVADYRMESSARAYLEFFGLSPASDAPSLAD